MSAEKIALACDHAGLSLKHTLADLLKDMGYDVVDLGCHEGESVDYPDFAYKMAAALKDGTARKGVLVCGSGIGVTMAANRYDYIRCALIHDALGARMCREHNDANVIAFGDRMIGVETAKDCLKVFLSTEFEGGRHDRRVEKLSQPPR